MKIHTLILLGTALALSAPVVAAKNKEADKQEREQKRRDKEVKQASKEASRYEKLKEFSVNLYESDPDFHDAVEQDFDNVLREHSDLAYATNISLRSSERAVYEDHFRYHVRNSLYDNLVIQDYVNRVGQHLVPADSEKLFAFRLKANPVPTAQTLATGTIYISTGLVAMLDNEAQLAYVLAHEMAHVYKDHWKLKSMLKFGELEYNKKQETKRAWWGLIGAAAGAGLGRGIGGSGTDAALGALIGGAAGYAVGSIANPRMNVAWDKVQEDEADKIAFKAALDADYDVREVPKFYVALQTSGTRDSRVTLGFIGERKRVRERIENCKDLIEKAYKADIEMKQNQGKLIGDNPKFRHLMAELKRDNGIDALLSDMLDMARNNLAEAVSIRSNDPTAHYYYGKVLKLVGRTPEEKKLADESFVNAAKYDGRGQNFGAHLHHALAMMDEKTEANKKLIVDELQNYVNTYVLFQYNNLRARLLPPNLDTIYEYMSLLGDTEWMPKLPNDAPMFLDASEVRVNPVVAEEAAPADASAPAAAAAQPDQPAKKALISNPLRKSK